MDEQLPFIMRARKEAYYILFVVNAQVGSSTLTIKCIILTLLTLLE